MRHGVAAKDRIEAALIDLAFRHDLPLVATNDCFFPNPEFYEAHDALLCIAEGTVVGQRERRRLNPSYSFKSAAEMRALFADVPEACDNTLVIARRCAYMPMPRKPILPAFPSDSGRDEPAELRARALDGLELRLDPRLRPPAGPRAAGRCRRRPGNPLRPGRAHLEGGAEHPGQPAPLARGEGGGRGAEDKPRKPRGGGPPDTQRAQARGPLPP